MREQDAVFLIYLPLTLLLYVLFSGHYLSAVLGRQPPRRLRGHIDRVFTGKRPSQRAAFGAYVGWTAFTQLVPLVIVLSDATGYVRAASALELVAAVGWTGYLLRPN
jgi:hypothetical protein